MGLGNTGAIVILVALSMFGIGMANKNFSADWNGNTSANWNGNTNYTTGWPYGHWNPTQTSKRIIIGGSENWHFGFNYTDWAIRNGPFFLNDKLVFKFDPPNDTTHPHSVSLLPNFWSFQNCDFRRAKRIVQVTQGQGEGFEFVIKRWQPYYFACGERNGFHCNNGMMKFAVWPLIRWY